MAAADFHHIDVVLWLLIDAKRSARVAVWRFTAHRRPVSLGPTAEHARVHA
jgi:hypothetical protein